MAVLRERFCCYECLEIEASAMATEAVVEWTTWKARWTRIDPRAAGDQQAAVEADELSRGRYVSSLMAWLTRLTELVHSSGLMSLSKGSHSEYGQVRVALNEGRYWIPAWRSVEAETGVWTSTQRFSILLYS